MEINLIIPRHPYGSLRDGAKREYLHLSPEGVAALDRLATCSRGAAAGLAIRMASAVIFGEPSIESIGLELAEVLGGDAGLIWTSEGLGKLVEILDGELSINRR